MSVLGELQAGLNAAQGMLSAIGPRPEGDPAGLRALAGTVSAQAEAARAGARAEQGLPGSLVFVGPAATRFRGHTAETSRALFGTADQLEHAAGELRKAAGAVERAQLQHDPRRVTLPGADRRPGPPDAVGMRIRIGVSSLRHGAATSRRIAHELDGVADRVAGLPHPEGIPPGVAGQLSSAASALRREAGAVGSQAGWLEARAGLALLADGPFGMSSELFGPQLQSPWAMPPSSQQKNKKKHWYDTPVPQFLKGVGEGAADLGTGVVKAGGALVAPVLPQGYIAPGVRVDLRPDVMDRWRKEYGDGFKYAHDHPGAFLKAMGKDAIAYDDHASGRHAEGAGRNFFEIATLLIAPTKAAKAAKAADAAKAAKRSERAVAAAGQDAARAEQRSAAGSVGGHTRDIRPRKDESPAHFKDRLEAKKQARIDAGERMRQAKVDSRAAEAALDRIRKEEDGLALEAEEARKELHHTVHHMPADAARDRLPSASNVLTEDHDEEHER